MKNIIQSSEQLKELMNDRIMKDQALWLILLQNVENELEISNILKNISLDLDDDVVFLSFNNNLTQGIVWDAYKIYAEDAAIVTRIGDWSAENGTISWITQSKWERRRNLQVQ